jgi:hypothetical protein
LRLWILQDFGIFLRATENTGVLRFTQNDEQNNFNSRSPSGMTSKKGNDNGNGNSNGNGKGNGKGDSNSNRDASGWVDEVGGGSSDFGEDCVAAVRGEWGFGEVGGYEDGGAVWGPEDGYVVGCAVVA